MKKYLLMTVALVATAMARAGLMTNVAKSRLTPRVRLGQPTSSPCDALYNVRKKIILRNKTYSLLQNNGIYYNRAEVIKKGGVWNNAIIWGQLFIKEIALNMKKQILLTGLMAGLLGNVNLGRAGINVANAADANNDAINKSVDGK
ncbi:MAG: hypothetical protein ORN57_04135, partial [Alphaproteobacteria bacterium]|nr:hypothetical protein [Alphaproteobacteria bacterium]